MSKHDFMTFGLDFGWTAYLLDCFLVPIGWFGVLFD